MLFEYIEQIRKKPHHTRKRFAFLIAVCTTSVVVAAWSLTLPARFASITIKGDDLVGAANVGVLGDQLREGRNNLQEVIETGNALSQDLSQDNFEGYDIEQANASFQSQSAEEATEPEVKKTQKVLIATSTTNVSGGGVR